jgi:hypothetical protein
MRLHIRGLRLWDFLTGELPCPSSPSAPAQPVISEKTTAAEKERLLADYKDHLAFYESQFHTYRTWLDEDACADSVLTASMEDRFAADIMNFERTQQMWSFLHQKYEFEPLHAQLLARRPYVSLMDALAEVHNEEVHLCDAGLLQSSTVLAARSSASRSSSARPTASVLLASPPVVPPAARGESGGLHCAHCGHEGHVEVFCYRKKKAQACRSSQGTDGTGSGGSESSSAGSETQEIVMLFHRLVASTSTRAVGTVTQSSALIGSAPTSHSSTLGPPVAPSPGTYSWYLDSVSSFHMTPHFAHLFSLRPSRHCIIHIVDGSPLSVAGHGTLSSDSFHVPDVSLVFDLTMQLISVGQITDHDCRVILDPDVCYIQDRRTGHLVGTGLRRCDSQHLWELDWLHLSSPASASPVSSACVASSMSSFAQWHHRLGHLSGPRLSALLH